MTLDVTKQLIAALVFASLLMLMLWCVQWFTKDASVVDVGWSAALGMIAIIYGSTSIVATWRTLFVAVLATLWSFRLAGYLLRDRVVGKSEDGRYRKLRSQSQHRAQAFFFLLFQVQALLAWIFSLPFLMAMRREGPLDLWDVVASMIWIFAIIGVTTADSQLSRFRADALNRGKTCRIGLWNWSRHPNYFFEWLYWWVYVVIAFPAPYGWTTLFAPSLMLFFLFKVTGIPATEAQALLSRGDDYRNYQQTTSVFVPWPPIQH